MLLLIFLLMGVSLILSWLLTAAMIRIAPRVGLVDHPGHRKIHAQSKPLGGGVAMFWAVAAPMLAALAMLAWVIAPRIREGSAGDGLLHWLSPPSSPAAAEKAGPAGIQRAYVDGALQQAPIAAGLLAGAFMLHVLGLIDDLRALGPWIKLLIQFSVTAWFVVFFDVRALTALDHLGAGKWPSVVLTIVWIVAIANAFNFLDNMDGLSAGVAAVCAAAFLITTILIGQWFVAATLAMLIGAMLGFLWFNFPPARIFMGDSGSLMIGFILGVLTVRTTFLPGGEDFAAGWYAIFAPVIVLAVPLYDLVAVSLIRLARGHSPFRGDTNHFSHRLVARGMSRRTAVLCIYVVTAATSASAIVLPWARSTFAAVLIFSQTMLVLFLVALLEQRPLPADWRNDEQEKQP